MSFAALRLRQRPVTASRAATQQSRSRRPAAQPRLGLAPSHTASFPVFNRSWAQPLFLRSLHTSTTALSWRTKMRPDLDTEVPAWELPESDPNRKRLLKANTTWYQRVPTDALIAKLKKDLDNNGSTRPGIVRIFLHKAHKPEHIRVLLQALSWLQARFHKDIVGLDMHLFAQACQRAKSPEMFLEGLHMPWLRMFPDVGDANVIFHTLVEMAEDLAFGTQPIKYHIPDKGSIPLEDSSGETVQVQKPMKRFFEAEQEKKETKEAAVKPTEAVDPAKQLLTLFHRVLKTVSDPRFNIKPDAYTVRAWLQFYATLGQTNKCLELRQQLAEFKEVSLEDESIALSYLLEGDSAKAEEYFKSHPMKKSSEPKAGKTPSPYTQRQGRVLLAILLSQGKDDEALALIKAQPKNQLLVGAWLNKPDRAEKIRALYTKAQAEVNFNARMRNYIKRFDKPSRPRSTEGTKAQDSN